MKSILHIQQKNWSNPAKKGYVNDNTVVEHIDKMSSLDLPDSIGDGLKKRKVQICFRSNCYFSQNGWGINLKNKIAQTMTN